MTIDPVLFNCFMGLMLVFVCSTIAALAYIDHAVRQLQAHRGDKVATREAPRAGVVVRIADFPKRNPRSAA